MMKQWIYLYIYTEERNFEMYRTIHCDRNVQYRNYDSVYKNQSTHRPKLDSILNVTVA